MFGRSKPPGEDDVALEVHRFSMEAFEVAKAFVTGQDPDGAKAKAAQLLEQVRQVAARAHTAPASSQADLNRVLSDARLDLTYVTSDGARPSSVRLAHLMEDLNTESG